MQAMRRTYDTRDAQDRGFDVLLVSELLDLPGEQLGEPDSGWICLEPGPRTGAEQTAAAFLNAVRGAAAAG